MKNFQNIPLSVSGKDTELKRVYLAFQDRPKTMKEVDKEVGIMRESICWYCRTLRLTDRLFPVNQKRCSVTKHTAWTWTTNPDLVLENPQLKLWENELSK